jgi:predicted component of type VI protein secretion system
VLRNLEDKIAGLVEGTFGRVFRSEVRPVELARRLAKEMDEHKTVSLSRTYVPNEYVVWLSPEDRARFEGVEREVIDELGAYLLEHARSERLALASRPVIEFRTDERLSLGEFGIQAHLIQPPDEESGEYEPQQADYGHTMVYSPDAEARKLVETPAMGRALLVGDGRRTVLSGARVVMGRSRECDVVIDDPNVSRRHAELRRQGDTWMVADLGSTNGVKVNGRRVEHAVLKPGDEIMLGLSRLSFEQE